MKKTILIFIVLFAVLFINAFADASINVYLNDVPLDFEIPPEIVNGRTMVPVRTVFEAIGASVSWDENTSTVFADYEGISVQMELNKPDILVNGKTRKTDSTPILKENRTLVSVRHVAESLGADVYWDSAERSVYIYKLPIPVYSGNPYIALNDNKPFFRQSEYITYAFEQYSDLDALGRCGPAYANICHETVPLEERGKIGDIKPTGWHTVRYEFIDGKYLYNRCHLIGYQLAGENANEKNLITGTRYLNVEGMLPFENKVSDYVEKTGNHVLYRATPVFKGNNLLADGVRLEAYSVEDNGRGICFNIFCYNAQPQVLIDYSTGDSRALDGSPSYSAGKAVEPLTGYIGNSNTKKFHFPSCKSVSSMSDKNKVYLSSREEAILCGYTPCANCKP